MNKILRYVLALAHTRINSVRIEDGRVVVGVRPHKRYGLRCPVCGRRCEHYDTSGAPRLWRAMDLARSMCYLEYTTRRVRCPEHGVLVEGVPWARHRARCTRDFEDWVAYLTVNCTVKAVTELARVEWHSVGPICSRVFDDLQARRGSGRLDGLRRIGIDETSYRKGHKYITVVVDHDRGCLVWAHAGTGKDVLNLFLDELTREQRRAIEVVTADGARWIRALVKKRCRNAVWVMDPFHVVQWMTDTNYFSKAIYAEMFEDLWEELRHLELADHTIAEIEESEVFKYSPYKGLTPDQRVALDKIMGAISNGFANAEPIVVEGMPGTGKTVLATYLLKMLKDDQVYRGLNVKLLEPVSQLRATLKQSVACVGGLSANDVIGPDDLAKPEYGFTAGEKHNVDILLVDETHRLKRRKCISNYGQYDKTARQLGLDVTSTQLEWILNQASLAIFFYDSLQTVGPSCVRHEMLESLLGNSLAKPIVLDTQARHHRRRQALEGRDSDHGQKVRPPPREPGLRRVRLLAPEANSRVHVPGPFSTGRGGK